FWEEKGIINFEIDHEEDLPGSIVDYEYTIDGIYEYISSTSEGDMIFNVVLTTRPQEFVLAQGSISLAPVQILPIFYLFERGDKVNFDFTVFNGAIEFFIFNQSQYNSWLKNNQSIQAIEVIHTKIEATGTVIFATTDYYFFVWYNDPNYNKNSVTVQLRLEATIIEKSIKDEIELDPITLETTDGEKVNDFGMDTSDWIIDDEISIEIDERDVEFTIEKEREVTINYNDEETEILCWVLEIDNYERIFVEETTYRTTTDITIWKSKYSGITLKRVVDTTFYDSNDSIFATSYTEFEVESASNVLLISKPSRAIFPLIPTMIALFVIFQSKRKKK
ncbi:MAG: hypothetical protein ACFFAE_05760, partial [Candidatus Hodarchaeota archaeon]